MEKLNRTNIANHLLEHQLTIVGKTKVDMIDDDMWRFNWTISKSQYDEFRKYAIPLLKKVFKFNSSKALSTFNWFYKQFGLRIK